MKKSKSFILIIAALFVFAASASAQNPQEDMLRTQVAATVIAEIQQTIIANGISSFQQTLQATGWICQAMTPTPAFPGADSAVNAVIAPTATPNVNPGNRASYDSQYPLDGVHVKKGEVFDITWYLLNTGTTTWTTDYSLRFFTGTNFTKPGKGRFYLNNEVAPNTVGACSVDAVAPNKSGTYTMSVVLGNENDENFYIMDITINVD